MPFETLLFDVAVMIGGAARFARCPRDFAAMSVRPETPFWSKIVTLIRYPIAIYSRKCRKNKGYEP